jgi:cytochrome c biogenesis protein CcmG, thiol:disulfide interchange protein DsbE
MIRYLLPLGVFIALLLLLGAGLGLNPRLVPSPLVGKDLPEFTLEQLRAPDQTLSRADLTGKVSLLNAWATWCVECRREHPVLVDIAKQGAVPVYGLNYKDQRAEALTWLERLGDPYIASGFDANGRVGIDLGVYGLPETFLVDAQGVIVHKHIGPISNEIWQRDFVPVIQRLQGGNS